MALSKMGKMEKEIFEIREDLEKYRKEEQNAEHLYIGLFGRTGCGKTSLINSLKYAVSGCFRKGKWFPVASLEHPGGHTRFRVIAELKNNISVIDNRGFDDLTQEATLGEIKAQMDGKRGYHTEVNWEKPRRAAESDVFNNAEDRKKYSIGCVVLVFSAQDNIFRINDGLQKAVDFFKVQEGRNPVAVITNVDNVERKRVVTLTASLQAVGISEIFEVANITHDKEDLEVQYQHNLLALLDRCMTDGDEAVKFKRHREKEQRVVEFRKARTRSLVANTTTNGAALGLVIGGPPGLLVGAGVGGAVGGAVIWIKNKFF